MNECMNEYEKHEWIGMAMEWTKKGFDWLLFVCDMAEKGILHT